MEIKQISLFIENKKGRLKKAMSIIGENDINIRALSLADSSKFGVLRMIVDDPEKAQKVLEANNLIVQMTDVIAVEVDDTPGGLEKSLEIIYDNDINLEYVYAFVEKKTDKALVVMKVDDLEFAKSALIENGISILDCEDISRL